MDNREKIEQSVGENPGVSFTELKEITGLANGVLQYHIRRSDSIEKKKGAILEKGFCDNCDLRGLCAKKCLLTELRDDRKTRILELKQKDHSQTEIASELGLDESTVSYHVSRLRGLGLIGDDLPVEHVKNHLEI